MTSAAKRIIIENIATETSEELKAIGLELLEIMLESGLYDSSMKLINMTHPGMIYGHIGVENCDSYIGLGGCSINIESFEIDEALRLKIKKTISIGYNTNNDVSNYAGHDYIAKSVNNTCIVSEEFKVESAMDVLDVIERVMWRDERQQVDMLKEIDFSTNNGKNQHDFFKAVKK
jgi:hypothetical protein